MQPRISGYSSSLKSFVATATSTRGSSDGDGHVASSSRSLMRTRIWMSATVALAITQRDFMHPDHSGASQISSEGRCLLMFSTASSSVVTAATRLSGFASTWPIESRVRRLPIATTARAGRPVLKIQLRTCRCRLRNDLTRCVRSVLSGLFAGSAPWLFTTYFGMPAALFPLFSFVVLVMVVPQ